MVLYKRLSTLWVSLTFLIAPVYASEPDRDGANFVYSVADMDRDGIADSLIYDKEYMVLTLKLSSMDFEPYSLPYPGEYETGVDIQAFEGGFTASSPHMRASNYNTYEYDELTGRFELTGFFHEHIHCGYMNLDLEKGVFTAQWNTRYDGESVTYYPFVEMPVYYDPVYLGEEPDFFSIGYGLLNLLEDIYEPRPSETVRFVEIICEYDEYDPSPWEYCDIAYIDGDGKRHCLLYTGDYDLPERDDMVKIEHGYAFCHDTSQERYLAVPAITGMEIVERGRVWEFHRNNKKKINLHDEARWAESAGEQVYNGVLYYFTIAGGKVKKYLERPGTMEVTYSTVDMESIVAPVRLPGIQIAMEISNEHKGKRKSLDKVFMIITPGRQLLYYRYDKKSGKLRLLEYN